MENKSKRQKEFETVDGGCSERKMRKEKTKKTTTVITASFTPDDRDPKRRTTSLLVKVCLAVRIECDIIPLTHASQYTTRHVNISHPTSRRQKPPNVT